MGDDDNDKGCDELMRNISKLYLECLYDNKLQFV